MRVVALLAIALLVAGCAAPAKAPAAPAEPDEPDRTTSDDRGEPVLGPLTLVDGTFAWNDLQPNQASLAHYALNTATQVAVAPCVFQGQPYFNDRPLPAPATTFQPRNGTLSVAMNWTAADFAGDHLVLAYRMPGEENYSESGHVGNGATLTLPIATNGTAPGRWELAACINDGEYGDPTQPGWQPGPFLGSFTVKAVFTPA